MGHIDPTKEVFAQFRANDRPGPIHMLNLVRLHAQAKYPDGRKATGAEAYAAYGRESAPVFERLGGRIVFGLAGDRFGAKRVLVIGLFAQALGAGAYFFVRQLGEFYAVAAVFGLIYGGIMPLYAVIAREYQSLRVPVPRHVANVRVRNVGTVGGNVATRAGAFEDIRDADEPERWNAADDLG